MITVKLARHAPLAVLDYINKLKKHTDNLYHGLFDTLKTPSEITSTTTTIFTAYNDDQIAGILVAKIITIQKKPYFNIIMFDADAPATYSALINELFSLMNETSTYGIFTTYFPQKASEISNVFLENRFKIKEHVYGIEKAVLSSKLSSRTTLTRVRFEQKNSSQYSKLLSDLFIEYDMVLNLSHNKTLSKALYPTRTKTRANRIAAYYLLDTVARSKQWYIHLFFHNDQPIGFIKAKLSKKSTICTPDLYIKPEYLKQYTEQALRSFIDVLPSQIQYINVITNREDQQNNATFSRWFNKPLGSSFYFI